MLRSAIATGLVDDVLEREAKLYQRKENLPGAVVELSMITTALLDEARHMYAMATTERASPDAAAHAKADAT